MCIYRLVKVMVVIIIKMADSNSNSAVKLYHCTECDSKRAYEFFENHRHGGVYVPAESFEVCEGPDCAKCKDFLADKDVKGKYSHIQWCPVMDKTVFMKFMTEYRHFQ